MSTLETKTLRTAELRAIARSVLADRATWEPLVRATPEQRHYELLRSDDHVTIWVIAWMEGHDTGYHDHDISAGAVVVAKGSIVDERLRLAGEPSTRVLVAGDVATFEVSEIHRVRHANGEPAVTIHVYSPPLERHGAYVIDSGGALLREPLSADHELRPLPVDGTLIRDH
jgi:predicted metal-dependent enzyme (double-stranded beta helix superfamily)